MKPPQTQKTDAPQLKKIKEVRDQIGNRNQTEMESTPPNFAAMVAKYQETPNLEMSNLLTGRSLVDTNLNRYERGFIFQVDPNDFSALLNPNPNPVNFKLRVHFAADPNYKSNQINATPGFIPLIQGIDDLTTGSYDNTFATTWVPANTGSLRGTTIENKLLSMIGLTAEVEIDSKTADQFMLTWLNVPTASVGGQFESSFDFPITTRVRYFTFGINDSEDIKDKIIAFGSTAQMFVYLGSFETFSFDDFAFDICTIIEVRGVASGGHTKSHFYEFGSPCPPAC